MTPESIVTLRYPISRKASVSRPAFEAVAIGATDALRPTEEDLKGVHHTGLIRAAMGPVWRPHLVVGVVVGLSLWLFGALLAAGFLAG